MFPEFLGPTSLYCPGHFALGDLHSIPTNSNKYSTQTRYSIDHLPNPYDGGAVRVELVRGVRVSRRRW